MNLWVRRIGQMMMASALFFFWGCEEELSVLGFKAEERFNVYYQEIPLESSVIFFDSLRTSNLSDETHRLLVGQYTDDLLGHVTAGAFSQYFRSSTIPDSLSFATFDSVSLHLVFDLYYFGSDDTSPQEIAIFEMEEELSNVSATLPRYYNNTEIQVGPQIGSKSFSVRADIFDQILEENLSEVVKIRTELDYNFGKRIFDSAVRLDGAATAEDSTFVRYSQFIKEFKGISIQSVQGNKVLGFNPVSSQSRIVLHFHVGTRDSLVLTFSSLAAFSKIVSDRSASDVSEVSTFYQDYTPASGNRYIQSGVGLMTKLDLTPFLEMADTIPSMIINSAEILISDVGEQPSYIRRPNSLTLRVLNDDNRFRFVTTQQDTALISAYTSLVVPASVVTAEKVSLGILNDPVNALAALQYSTNDKKYNGYITRFLQELYKNRKNGGPQLPQIGLFPNQVGKTVNRASFNKDNIVLRIYYTRPTTNAVQ